MKNSKIRPIFHDLEIIGSIILKGNPGILLHEMKRRLDSRSSFFGLLRDFTKELNMPRAKIPISVRPLETGDIPYILKKTNSHSDADLKDQARRSLLIKAGFSMCFVAADQGNRPCYMQWLIGPDENRKVQDYFKGGFPWLNDGEVLLEGAYTPPDYRGLGIMACAMFQIAEKGKALGARRAITFVHRDNTAAIAGCNRAGFFPYLVRDDVWKNFRRTLIFTPMHSGAG